MESKLFEVEVYEKKGRLQATIMERKRGISSWIRLGPASLGLFLNCLVLCIKDVRTVKWVRKWKENGRAYSLVRDQNKWGCFLRLDVVDIENKRFSIFIPKGRGAKGGWVLMVETLRRLGCANGGMISQKEEELCLKPSMVKTFAEVVKMSRGKDSAIIKVEVTKKELCQNLNKLAHCVVGIWNPSAANGDDLRSWETHLAKSWSLKGNLGLAKLDRGKVLMEFELLIKAEQAINFGSISVGGIFLSLEKWRSETRCLREGENKSEAWVRVLGLPVSLWEQDIMRKIGKECGGFFAVDSQTEKMEEL